MLNTRVEVRRKSNSRSILARGRKTGGYRTTDIGYFRGSQHHSGFPTAVIAAFNEWGVPARNVPSRPFMQASANRLRGKDKKGIIEAVKQGYNARTGEMTLDGVMRVGQHGQAIMRLVIEEFDTPPNAPFTIARKGFDNPLIEQRMMKEHTSHRSNR